MHIITFQSGVNIVFQSIQFRINIHFYSWFYWVKLLNQMAYFFSFFFLLLLVNCQTNWSLAEKWHSTWKWEFEALVHYVTLARLQSSSAGVSLGPLSVLNNASYSLSRELISSKLSNQHWRAWRALEGWGVQSDWGGLFKKKHLIWTWKIVVTRKTGPQQQKGHGTTVYCDSTQTIYTECCF